MVRFSPIDPLRPGRTFLVQTDTGRQTPSWLLVISLRRLGGLGGQPVELLETITSSDCPAEVLLKIHNCCL